MKAKAHSLQAERLKVLRGFGILDTSREAEFDEIVDLAAKICEAPISVINFIDADRQWFKAETGLNTRQTPLETSICSHVILENAFVEIPDTLSDERMKDNPLCLAEKGLRFYAGALLQTCDGLPLGTLCILDYSPRRLSLLQRQAMEVLARQVMTLLEYRQAMRQQDVLRREMDHRVKNSLQTVAALVRLHSFEVNDPTARAAFDAVGRRIDSIGLLHQELHQASAAEAVSIARYIRKVADLLRVNLPAAVALTCEFEELDAGSDVASALAMIISESVANASKHAFPDNRGGAVAITGRRVEPGKFEVRCADNGVGSNARLSAADGVERLGMRIVDASAQQIGGVVLRAASTQGFTLTLTFPITEA